MSNPDSFIDEVTEEVRRDRLFAVFRKYGWIALLLVALIVGGAAWSEWQKSRKVGDAQAFGTVLLDALDADTPAERRAALAAAELPATAGPDKAALRQLLVASDAQQDPAATLAALDAIIADTAVSQDYRDLAVLRRVILGADAPVADRRALLEPLSAPGRPFRPLALEQLAYLLVEEGKAEGAITGLRALTQDQQAPAGLRARAAQMIVALGGESAEG